MLLSTLGASLFGNMLAGKGINRAEDGAMTMKQGQEIIRAGYGSKRSVDKSFQFPITF